MFLPILPRALLAAAVLLGAVLAARAEPQARSAPAWTEADIRASRVETADASALLARPVWKADPANLLLVVEGGDHHVSIVDGERFDRIHRFASRAALNGEPQFASDGRHVFLSTQDGWITKYDLWALRVVAEVRAGLQLGPLSLSGDGRWLMAASYPPHALVLLDTELNLERVMPVVARDGRTSSRVAALHDAQRRMSFIVALQDVPELWEISYDPKAEDLYDGLVHDYRFGEGVAKKGFLGIRRTVLAEPMDDFLLDPAQASALGATRHQPAGQVVNLDVRRRVAGLPIAGSPRPGAGIVFAWRGTYVLASRNLQDASVAVVDLKDYRLVATIATAGPGRFLRRHDQSRFAWADATMSPTEKDMLTIIDTVTLEVVARLREPGSTFSDVAFTRDGRHALASLLSQAGRDGALVVYDAATFTEIKRLPMNQPLGAYRAHHRDTRRAMPVTALE